MNDPTARAERRLLAAIIDRALRDVKYGTPSLARDAKRYFDGPNLDHDCDWLEIDPVAVRTHVEKLMSKRLFTDEQILAYHARYAAEEMTLETLAAELRVAPATLSRYFAAAGLPVRKPGRTPGRVAARRAELDELNRIITDLVPSGGVRSLRITFEFDVSGESQE